MELRAYLSQLQSCDLEVYNYLEPMNLSVARKRFWLDCGGGTRKRCPDFQYRPLRPLEVEQNLTRLEQLNPDEVKLTGPEKALYAWAWKEIRAKNRLYWAAYQYQNATAREEYRFVRDFTFWDYCLYGAPDEPLFRSVLQEQLDWIASRPLSEEDRQTWFALSQELVNGVASRVSERYQPRQTSIQQFGELVRAHLAPYLTYLPEGQAEFTPREVIAILNQILQEQFQTEFRAELADRASILVNQHRRRILIPTERNPQNFAREEVITLVLGHELGTHVARSVPYERGHWPMLGTGLPGVERFEEGLAICVEQALEGQYRTRGLWRALSHYVNIGLATFLHYDFRKVLEVRMQLNFLAEGDQNEPQAERRLRYEQAYTRAFDEAKRCFRGFGELISGRDLLYLTGNTQAWLYIEHHLRQPEELWRNLFQSGKTDPENPYHRQLLQLDAE